MAVDDEIVTFRLGPRDRAAIQRLIDGGEFRNRSDFLRFAVKNVLDDYESRASADKKPRVDMEMDGIDISAGAGTPRGPRARPTSRKGLGL